jgi:NADH-quinone oxidoreductase subunit F
MSKNLSELSGRGGIVDNLFEKMGQAAKVDGSPIAKDLQALADEFLVGTSSTYGATSFYDLMKPENQGKKVYVCNGSACLCAGTQQSVQEVLTEHFAESEIGHMTCLGRCHENAAFHYQGKNYSAKSANEITDILNGQGSNRDSYHVGGNASVLTSSDDGFDEIEALIKSSLNRPSLEILDEIKNSQIRGRGGAGFPMGFKLDSCRNTPGDTKFIICNADEGDPGAYSDRYLLEIHPFAVLYGMMMSGYVVGAQWGIVYIRAEYPESIKIVQKAIDNLREHKLIGENICDSGFNFDIKIIQAQGAYICGEETALINSIEGQRPEVRVRPPYPTQQGLFNKPTVVNNVETQAALFFIIKNGGQQYKSLGTEKSAGTKLVCLDSYFNKPGVYEVEMGTPLSEVIYRMGGGFHSAVKALHIGGPLGGMVPVSKIDELTVDFESFSKAGFLLGHASVVSIPEDFPIVKYLEHIFDFAAYESCGKCFPCRLGTTRAHEMLSKAQRSDYKIPEMLFDDLLDTLEQGSLCAHGGGIPLPARNALQYFGEELKHYFE